LLTHLEQTGWIAQRTEQNLTEILFRSHPVKEWVYHTLPVNQKKQLHYQSAVILEQLFENNLQSCSAILTRHYERGGNSKKALEYTILAAKTAFKTSAFSRSLTYFRKAIEILEPEADSPECRKTLSELEEKTGLIYYHRGYYVEAVDYLDRALAHMGNKPISEKAPLSLCFCVRMAGLLFKLFSHGKKHKKIPTAEDERYSRILIHQGLRLSRSPLENECTSSRILEI
jgi:tetratricopeptide (TPR) repeat protein